MKRSLEEKKFKMVDKRSEFE